MKAPPRLWHRFFRWFCHPNLLPGVEGDLMELYNERLAESGKRKADRRFIIDVLLLFRLGIIRPVEGSYHLNSYGMLKNYLKVGVRNILKYKAFSFINVFGLAAAMSVCMLIILMLADQNSYDRFHPKKDRIYRILSDSENFKQAYATSPFPLAEALRTDYPSVENATYLMPGVGGDATYSERAFEMRGYFAEPAFFEVFGFDLKAGNESIALAEPNSIVISSRVAAHLFGDENPVGKVVDFADRKLAFPLDYGASGAPSDPWGSFTVTGVVDGDAYRSHLKFDVLMSASTRQRLYTENKIENLSDNWSHYWQCYTYILLDETKTLEQLQISLADVVARKYKDITSEEVKGIRFEGQQLADVAMGLASNDTNQRLPGFGYYFLGLLASVVLVCACLNYTSLSIARATTRAREIGVRKTNGANRGNLVIQFLSESILTSLLALVIALVLLVFLKAGFMNLWINKHFNFDLQANLSVYFAFIAFAVMIGLVAGAYPAFYMAGYKPVQALKNTVARGRGKMGFKKALGITQFVISLLFIVTSILIFRQFNHYMNFQYGFTSDNIVNIELQGNNYQLLAAELSAVPGVASVSACDVIPSGGVNNNTSIRHAGSEDDFTRFGALNVDHQFIETIGVKLLAGRQLPPSGELSNKYVLMNEAAVKAMGFQHPSDIVGAVFETEWDREPKEVIGVVADFRFKLLINEDKIAPLMVSNQTEAFEYLNVKLASKDVMGTVSQLEARWKSIDPVHPFKYQFFDEQLAATHQAFFDIVTILGCMAFLSILIACLGLLGMATYSTERRTKEVGIRKALGAAESSIAILLSREFLGMLLIAIGIAAPLSYFLNNLWLQNLPNRVEFGFGTVALASGMLLVLGLVTIGSQTLRASRRNPVDALRSE